MRAERFEKIMAAAKDVYEKTVAVVEAPTDEARKQALKQLDEAEARKEQVEREMAREERVEKELAVTDFAQ